MQPLAPTYLAEIARQIGFIAAFLGGVSATFMVGLLALPSSKERIAGRAILCAAAASIAFVVAVMATTMLVVALHPDAPAGAAEHAGPGRAIGLLAFLAGIYLLLTSLALAGFLRSGRTGWATTALLAAAGGALVALVVVR
ncbi:MAG TPA: hypothetical protein VF548_16885 [Allosphingosinicella sp.]|jgi:hypothetical protein